MHVPATTLVSSGAERSSDAFGILNRTDSTISGNNVLKIDNLYFSTKGPNQNPIAPSF
jgi:hypothetical protein